MNPEDAVLFVEEAIGKGLAAPDVARALGEQYPGLSLADGAPALRRLAALARPAPAYAASVAQQAEGMGAQAVAAVDGAAAAAAAADPVEDAAYQASLMRAFRPHASPTEIGTQVRTDYPTLTVVQMAQVLIHGAPTPVFPDLVAADMAATLVVPAVAGADAPGVAQALRTVYPALAAVDVGRALMGANVFPAITAPQMTDALTTAGFAAGDVSAAVAALFPVPGQRLLMAFTGSNQVQIPSLADYNFQPGQDYTVEAWIRAPQQTNLRSWDNNIIEKWSDDGNVPGRTGFPFSLRIGNQNGGSAGRLLTARYDLTNNPTVTSSGTFLDDRWHHVAVTCASRQITMYVDGAVQGTAQDNTQGNTGNDWPLYLGVRGGQMWPDNFTGRIMEVRIWNVARSADQIVAAMRRTVDPTQPGLVGYFKLREGSGTAALDSSNAKNNGVITDPQWSPASDYPLVDTIRLAPVGGPGTAFDDTAAALATGQPLTRIRIHCGNIVDNIQAFYGDQAIPLPAHGGTGGGLNDVVVDPNDPIVTVSGSWGLWFGATYILSLTFTTRSGKTAGPFGNQQFAVTRNPFSFTVPDGATLLAFAGTVAAGNNGQWFFLGSLGLVLTQAYA